jgi:hypothetical protein
MQRWSQRVAVVCNVSQVLSRIHGPAFSWRLPRFASALIAVRSTVTVPWRRPYQIASAAVGFRAVFHSRARLPRRQLPRRRLSLLRACAEWSRRSTAASGCGGNGHRWISDRLRCNRQVAVPDDLSREARAVFGPKRWRTHHRSTIGMCCEDGSLGGLKVQRRRCCIRL